MTQMMAHHNSQLPAINKYVCQSPRCQKELITIQNVKGVIPYFIICPHCADWDNHFVSQAQLHNIYKNCLPSWEWVKPSVEEIESKDGLTQQYIALGGLFLRPIPVIDYELPAYKWKIESQQDSLSIRLVACYY